MKIFFAPLVIGLLLIGCNPVPAPTTASTPISTLTFRQGAVPSPTAIQLPFNPEVKSDEYCKVPYALLPVSENNDISEEEIVYELVKIWLRRYIQPDTPLFCRIDDYTIDKVYNDPSLYSTALEPRGDFMRVIAFSVKLTQLPSDWMSFPGELDQDNWLHSGHVVAITRTGEGYKMEFANP